VSPLSGGDRNGITLFGVCALVLLTGGVVASLVEHATPKLDSTSLRAIGKPTNGCVSILVDVTDPLSPAQLQSLVEQARGLEVAGLHPNELVSIWKLGPGEGQLDRAYARYYPGRTANPVWGNSQRVAARCDSLFWKPMLEHFKVLPQAASDRSPILESVREISEQPEFSELPQPRRLVIASDLVQHTSELSFYESVPTFESFKTTHAFGKLRADLHGVSVQVLYLSRPSEPAAMTAQLRNFWRGYLRECGASSVTFRRL